MNANDTLEPLLDKGDHSIDLTPPEDVRAASQSGDDRVYFNVGGVVFQTLEATIKHLRNKKFKVGILREKITQRRIITLYIQGIRDWNVF